MNLIHLLMQVIIASCNFKYMKIMYTIHVPPLLYKDICLGHLDTILVHLAIKKNRFVCPNATYPEKSCLHKFFYIWRSFFFNQIDMKTNKHLILQFLFLKKKKKMPTYLPTVSMFGRVLANQYIFKCGLKKWNVRL